LGVNRNLRKVIDAFFERRETLLEGSMRVLVESSGQEEQDQDQDHEQGKIEPRKGKLLTQKRKKPFELRRISSRVTASLVKFFE
jgi:hypothetical protein